MTYRTGSPTVDPTVTPSILPTSSVPSALPSISGWITTITATTTLTQPLERPEINEYIASVAEFYGVEVEAVDAQTSYTSSVIMSISSTDAEEQELIESITNTIVESIGVHPSGVDVVIDMTTGEVEISITSEDYTEAASNQFLLENEQRIDSIIESIERGIPDIVVENYDVANDIAASLEFTVDANDASNDLTQAAWQSEQFLSDFDVVIESSYVTHAPTAVPSSKPTTSLPSASPSLTGAIGTVVLFRTATESISSNEIISIQNEIADAYDIESDDITIDIIYETTGSIAFEIIDDTLTNEQVEETVEDEIAALLGIHEENIDVTIEDGVARYIITSDSVGSAQDIQDSIRDSSSTDALITAIIGSLPVNVTSVEVNEDIRSEIIVTVDTTGAKNNLENAARELEEAFEQQGFIAQVDSNLITFKHFSIKFAVSIQRNS